MEHVTKMITKARVTNSWVDVDYHGGKQVRFELTWDKNGTYKYIAEEFVYEEISGIIFNHDYDSIGYKCPLCNKDNLEDCIELSEEVFEVLKGKLMRSNLKLMYAFK